MPELARAQRWILDNILAKLPVEPPAHGFVPGRSTVTNASPHRGRDLVVNLDLEGFFPTLTFPRVRGLFASLGYSKAAASVLAALCTEASRRPVEYGGTRYQVAVGSRALPQGACTSPAISNQIARTLDRRLSALCERAGWRYTRYADDLTFSTEPGKRADIGRFIAKVRHIVEDEGFAINEKKGRVQRAGGRQTVTGIVVNEPGKLGLPRDEVRRLRAILHNAKKTGLAKQNRDRHPHFEAYLRGKIAYLAMIDPDKGAALRRELDALNR
jgi:retron-type reverse transcriptase